MGEVTHAPKRRWAWHFSWIGLLLVALFGDVWVGKFVFHRLCATEGGQEIHRVVEGVEGVLVDFGKNFGCDPRCMELLGTYRYRFIEMHVNAPNKRFFASTPGNHRFYLTERNRKECAAFDHAFAGKDSFRTLTEQRFGITNSMCVGSVQVEQPESSYVYTSAWQHGNMEALGISRHVSTITERTTGKVLARRTAFSRPNGHGWLMRLSGLENTSQSCHSPGDLLLVKTLKPTAG